MNNPTPNTIFWLAGEKSGDLHAAEVIKQINTLSPKATHIGIGGPLMQAQGLQTLFPFEKFCVMGFVEVIEHLFFFMKVEKAIYKYFVEKKPDLVVLVDYPGLNLRIAKMAHKLNIKVVYYICPQFWAWKQHRVHKLKKYCSYVACILPFEEPLIKEVGVQCSYVGHPVCEEVQVTLSREQFAELYGLDVNKKWIGFLPGSRTNEVKKLLPIYLKIIQTMSAPKKHHYQFLISKTNSVDDDLFTKTQNQTPITLIPANTYELMKYSHFLIVKSGTSTIETAIIGTPFVIVYKANYLSYLLARWLIKVKYIGLPNLIFDAPVVPELIQADANPDKIIDTISHYIDNEQNYQSFCNALDNFNRMLGEKSASKTVADIILSGK